MSVNRVMLIGRLGKDPESRRSKSDLLIVRFSLATDRHGNKDDGPDWHNITCFGKTAELCERYLSKGRQVYLEGRLSYSQYEKDGETRYYTEVIANNVQFLGGRDDTGGAGSAQSGSNFGGGSSSNSGRGSSSGGGFGGGSGGGGFDDTDIPF